MLPKSRKIQRLLFKSVLFRNKSFRSDNLLLVIKKIENLEQSKFSFVVSKKVVKKANKRNLVKRIGYSIIKNKKSDIKSGFVCVFFVKKDVSSIPFLDFTKEVVILLKKSGLYK